MDRKTIKARRLAIEAAASCEGCGATLTACLAQRGKDPTAPSWFGCCARGLTLDVPCRHVPDHAALSTLLIEIERGKVRDPDQMLLDQIEEYPWSLRRAVLAGLPEKWDGR